MSSPRRRIRRPTEPSGRLRYRDPERVRLSRTTRRLSTARVAIVRSALVDSLDGTVRIDARGEPVVDLDPLDGATLWLASDLVAYVPSGVRTTYGDLLAQRRALADVAVDWGSLTTVARDDEERTLADLGRSIALDAGPCAAAEFNSLFSR